MGGGTPTTTYCSLPQGISLVCLEGDTGVVLCGLVLHVFLCELLQCFAGQLSTGESKLGGVWVRLIRTL